MKPLEKTAVVSKVMVIDDHILFREGLMSLFRSTPDFEVVGGAGSIAEGVEMAHSLQPDIILMDFSLPDGTGLEATETILTILPECKIIFLTVYETDEKLMAAIRTGAKGYMLKNIAGADLIASLRALDRGEMAISRKMMSRAIEELSRTAAPGVDVTEAQNRLSNREIDILRELETGSSNLEIANRLFISENTVKHHLHNLFEKLGVENRRQAAAIARQLKLKGKQN